MKNDLSTGAQIYDLVKRLFPICRSITGDGVRETLRYLSEYIPINIHEIPTGTKVFDWTIPDEWNIYDAYVEEVDGPRVIDFNACNLHVVGYSEPVDTICSLEELQKHLFSLPDQPDAVPYVTSYYKKDWGFCISHNKRATLRNTKYRCVINSKLAPGSLTYAECFIQGESQKEVFLSSYVCHPSMANNELSGPAVLTYIVKWLLEKPRRHSYRIVLIPETIGSIAYISRHLDALKNNTLAGFNLSCIGDDNNYSYVASRYGNTYADRVAQCYFENNIPSFTRYSFLDRASDERQYCSAGVDLPLVALCRSKYGTFPQYHTSLDDLSFVSPRGLQGGYDMVQSCLNYIENNFRYKSNCLCEPQLGKRGLYPTTSIKSSALEVKTMMDALAYMDGENDILDISRLIGRPVEDLIPVATMLQQAGLLSILPDL